MQIQRVLQSLVSLVGRGAAPAKPVEPIQALQPGQRLEAQVLTRLNDRQLLLELAGQRLVADSRIPLRPGTRVRLEVVKPGSQPQLRVLEPVRQLRTTSLKTLLPRQIPVAEAMQALAGLAAKPSPGEALPTPLRDSITHLLQSLPTLRDLTSADGLARALDRSGLFSETPSRNAAPNLKAQLLQIAAVLRQLRPETRKTASKATVAEPSSTTLGEATTSVSLPSPRPRNAASPNTSTPTAPPPSFPDGGTAPSSRADPTADTERPGQVGAASRRLLPQAKGTGAEVTPEPSAIGAPKAAKTSAPMTPPEPGSTISGPGRLPAASPHPPPPPDSNPASPDPAEVGERLEQLSHKVSGAIARIVLDQLNSLPRPENPTSTWHFELPFRLGQEFHDLRLTIRGEEKKGDPGDGGMRPWTVDLEMALPRLGKIHARLIYVNGEISTHLWSNQAATRSLFERHLEHLAQRFREAGLAPQTLRVAEVAFTSPRTRPDTPLINERI